MIIMKLQGQIKKVRRFSNDLVAVALIVTPQDFNKANTESRTKWYEKIKINENAEIV